MFSPPGKPQPDPSGAVIFLPYRLGEDGDSVSRRNSVVGRRTVSSTNRQPSLSSTVSSLGGGYDQLLSSSLAPFLRNSRALGGSVQVAIVTWAWP